MEYAEHGDLAHYLDNHAETALVEAKDITRQILNGLVVMHQREICHRDLKPQVRNTHYYPNIVAHIHISGEHSCHIDVAYLGQNHRFRNLKTNLANIVKDRLRHELLSSPRGVGAAPQAHEIERN